MQYRRLEELERQGRPIRVGLIGLGRMGLGVLNQINASKGMRVVAVSDLTLECAETLARPRLRKGVSLSATNDLGSATQAVERGEMVATGDSAMLCRLPIDVVVEATGIPESGATIAAEAIGQKKHVVTLNVESDAVIGPILKKMADDAGVIYTVIDGDEPGTTGRMFNFAKTCGLEVVVAGKGCMHRIDWNANAYTLAEEGKRVGINPKMLASFRDGSKHCVEVCVIANGTGLVPDVRGTHARSLAYNDVTKVLCPKEDGGILGQRGVVELTPPIYLPDGTRDLYNSITPGVFLIVTSENREIREDFKYLLMGDGPYFMLHRPYHLCAIEVPFSVADAVLYNNATLSPIGTPVAEVICVAKKDLQPGEVLTGSGGAEITGMIEKRAIAREQNLVPLGLSYDVKMARPVKKGEALTLDQVELAEDTNVYKLWRKQEEVFGLAEAAAK